MEATATAPPANDEAVRRSSPILDYLAEHGPSVGSAIADALGRATGNVTTRLRQMEAEGRVRRTGRSLPAGRGGPQIEWALADGSPPPDSIDAPTPSGVTAARVRQELAELIRADDLDRLLDGYCRGITLAEADADTLARVLRVRRTIELLSERADGDPE
jgi:predicted ArsR family transcriptional regulator